MKTNKLKNGDRIEAKPYPGDDWLPGVYAGRHEGTTINGHIFSAIAKMHWVILDEEYTLAGTTAKAFKVLAHARNIRLPPKPRTS